MRYVLRRKSKHMRVCKKSLVCEHKCGASVVILLKLCKSIHCVHKSATIHVNNTKIISQNVHTKKRVFQKMSIYTYLLLEISRL